jgi:hypothetical protein
MIITSSVNHLFANKGFRSNLGFRIHSLSASQTKVQQNHYVYVMQFEGDKIVHMTKIWNAGLALKDLGWA